MDTEVPRSQGRARDRGEPPFAGCVKNSFDFFILSSSLKSLGPHASALICIHLRLPCGANGSVASPFAHRGSQRYTPASQGAVAQLGERVHGMHEVRGSSPLSSISSLVTGDPIGGNAVQPRCSTMLSPGVSRTPRTGGKVTNIARCPPWISVPLRFAFASTFRDRH